MNEETTVKKKKKLSKRKIALICILAIIIVLVTIVVIQNLTTEYERILKFELKSDGTYKFVGTDGSKGFKNKEEGINKLIIPSEYEGKKVTEAYFNRLDADIDTIIISEGITSVSVADNHTFFNIYDIPTLSSLTLPSTLTEFIGWEYLPGNLQFTMTDGVVYQLKNNCVLDKVSKTVVRGFDGCTLFEGAEKLGECAFEGTTLGDGFVLPETLIEINGAAFRGAQNMPKKLILSEKIEWIGNYAFANSNGVEELQIFTQGERANYAFYDFKVTTLILDVHMRSGLPACTFLYQKTSTIPDDDHRYDNYIVESDMPEYTKFYFNS